MSRSYPKSILSSILPFFCFESVSHECTLVYLTSPTDKHLGCFQSFSILINNVGMNNCVHISFIYLLYTYIICIYKSICKINYPATNVQFRQFWSNFIKFKEIKDIKSMRKEQKTIKWLWRFEKETYSTFRKVNEIKIWMGKLNHRFNAVEEIELNRAWKQIHTHWHLLQQKGHCRAVRDRNNFSKLCRKNKWSKFGINGKGKN